MKTYQDFEVEKAKNRIPDFIRALINDHKSSNVVKTAIIADAYDRQENVTIEKFTKKLFKMNGGGKFDDITASNMRIASNFFNTLNNQRVNYSLGNGVTFSTEGIKEQLGNDFDTALKKTARFALIHGVSFMYFNKEVDGSNKCYCFKVTEFAPLYDESTGILRAGVRYYQMDQRKPLTAVLYEEDGFTIYRTERNGTGQLMESQPKRAYKVIIQQAPADEEPEVIGEENYSRLPVVPMWGSDLKQSTLVGMRQAIDSYDLIRSGYANDLQDCAQVYWLISGAMGMTDSELAQFRDRLLFNHIALADLDNSQITPYTQEIPYQARSEYLSEIRNQLYDDFGALDVTNISSQQKTATEIQAAYQPVDDRADDFEYQIIQCVQQILKLINVDDVPIFKRNKIVNQLEQVQLVMAEAEYLDDETVLNKLPNITPDEVKEILKRKDAEMSKNVRYTTGKRTETDEEEEEDNPNDNE